MYKCPACGAGDATGRTQCRCGADLTLLQALDAVADAWFNRGLQALDRDAPGEALEWFCACCAARPSDVAARLAQAKTWARLERYEQARDALEKARKTAPDAEGLDELAQALEEAMKPVSEQWEEAQGGENG